MDISGEPVYCRAGRAAYWVAWNGNMMPCGMMTRPLVSLNEISFEEAWEQIREAVKYIRLPGKCSSCKSRHACAVCAAACLAETGDFDRVPEYLCRMAEEGIKETERLYREMDK